MNHGEGVVKINGVEIARGKFTFRAADSMYPAHELPEAVDYVPSNISFPVTCTRSTTYVVGLMRAFYPWVYLGRKSRQRKKNAKKFLSNRYMNTFSMEAK